MSRIEIFSNQRWHDVTDKSAVLYGAGGGLSAWWRRAQIPSISYVVDGNPKKWGNRIQIGKETYTIESPEVLRGTNPDEHFILAPGNVSIPERLGDALRFAGNSSILNAHGDDIRYVYQSLEEMLLLDPVIHDKISEQNISRSLQDLITKFHTIARDVLALPCIDRFIPIRRGHKIAFCFGNNESIWFCSIRGGACIYLADASFWRPIPGNVENLNEIYETRKRYEIEQDLTLYEDSEGFLIQEYAGDIVDFRSDRTREQILRKLRKIHLLPVDIGIKMNPIRRYFHELKQIKRRQEEIPTWLDGFDKSAQPVLAFLQQESWEQSLCHGDFHPGNIVGLNEDVHFIDWDFLCISDPFYDICRFLFYSSIDEFDNNENRYMLPMIELYRRLPNFLNIYYGRLSNEREQKHIAGMMLLCECIEMFLRVLRHQRGTDEISKMVQGRLKEWMDVR